MSDAVDVASKGLDLADKWASQLGDALHKYGPDAAQLALAIGRVGAIQTVGSGLICAAIAVAAAKAVVKFVTIGRGIKDPDKEFGYVMTLAVGGAVIGIAGFACAISAIVYLTNLYAWVGMFNPAIYLAAKALNL
jgi:hypothetical protein